MPRYLGMIKILGLPSMSKANVDSNSKPRPFKDVRQNSFTDTHDAFRPSFMICTLAFAS